MSGARGPRRFRRTLGLRDSALSHRLPKGPNLVSTESGQLRGPLHRNSIVGDFRGAVRLRRGWQSRAMKSTPTYRGTVSHRR